MCPSMAEEAAELSLDGGWSCARRQQRQTKGGSNGESSLGFIRSGAWGVWGEVWDILLGLIGSIEPSYYLIKLMSTIWFDSWDSIERLLEPHGAWAQAST